MNKNLVLSNSPNWVITSFVNGAFGHLLGRCLATSPDVKWYDFHLNGITPWEWNHFSPQLSFGVSPTHFFPWFDISNGKRAVPWFGRFEKWNNTATFESFNEPWLVDILKTHKLIIQSHDDPAYIRERFPNAKIILVDIADSDWASSIKNHIEKSGSYAAMIDSGQEIDPALKAWTSETTHTLMRDWEQYSMKLTPEQWIGWHVNDIKQDMANKRLQAGVADAVFSSSDRNNVEAIAKLQETVGLAHDIEKIQQVLDSFNLDKTIKKYLDKYNIGEFYV